jgi:hypothetical protein
MEKLTDKQQQMVECLERALGVVSTACRAANISRTTHYRWLENEEYASAVRDIQEVAVDFAESHLHKLIQDGNPAATIFFLKTKGKSRGYIERQEIDHTDSGLNVQVEIVKSQD